MGKGLEQGLAKLWPATCFCVAREQRMAFTFFSGPKKEKGKRKEKNKKEHHSVACENYVKFKCQ